MSNDTFTLILLCLLWTFIIALRVEDIWKEIGLWIGAETLPRKLIDFQRRHLRKKEPEEERYSNFLWKLGKVDSWKINPPLLYMSLLVCVFILTQNSFFQGEPSESDACLLYYSILAFYGLLGIHLIICVKAWIRELNEQIFLKKNS